MISIEHTHRESKPRPIIIQLVRYNDRKKILKLKEKKIAVTESLMVTHLKKLNEARKGIILKMFGPQMGNVYTQMGREKLRYIIGDTI